MVCVQSDDIWLSSILKWRLDIFLGIIMMFSFVKVEMYINVKSHVSSSGLLTVWAVYEVIYAEIIDIIIVIYFEKEFLFYCYFEIDFSFRNMLSLYIYALFFSNFYCYLIDSPTILCFFMSVFDLLGFRWLRK